MAKHLEWYSRKPANADELAKVGPHCNGAWQDYEKLQGKSITYHLQ